MRRWETFGEEGGARVYAAGTNRELRQQIPRRLNNNYSFQGERRRDGSSYVSNFIRKDGIWHRDGFWSWEQNRRGNADWRSRCLYRSRGFTECRAPPWTANRFDRKGQFLPAHKEERKQYHYRERRINKSPTGRCVHNRRHFHPLQGFNPTGQKRRTRGLQNEKHEVNFEDVISKYIGPFSLQFGLFSIVIESKRFDFHFNEVLNISECKKGAVHTIILVLHSDFVADREYRASSMGREILVTEQV
ncbi:unnamed protein product [Cuscuta campestris]|uniref:Uncharacterized protein n=1 Tax=Cuscuta campestris TaxID=132261 RepID=A0A484L5F7_9ASTE|nr:unnamed protein product [Cuscuta campestris]